MRCTFCSNATLLFERFAICAKKRIGCHSRQSAATKPLGIISRFLTTIFGSRNAAALFATMLRALCCDVMLLFDRFAICSKIKKRMSLPTIIQSGWCARQVLGTVSRSPTTNLAAALLLRCDVTIYLFCDLRQVKKKILTQKVSQSRRCASKFAPR